MKFKFKFSKTMLILFILGFVLAAGCLAFNVARLVNAIVNNFELNIFVYLSIGLCLVLPVIFAAFLASALACSNYTLKETEIVVRFGILAEKYAYLDISKVVKNIRTEELTVCFQDGSSYRIVIAPAQIDDFSAELLKKYKAIEYCEIDEEPKKKK